jgi:uncharacterized protein YkwD
MGIHTIFRRAAVGTIMVALAAVPAGLAHSAEVSEGAVATAKSANLVEAVDTSGLTVAEELGLPAKPIALINVAVTPAAPVAVPVPAPVPAAAASTPAATNTTTTKTTTTKVAAPASAKKTTTAKTTAKTATKTAAAAPATAAVAVAPAATTDNVTARQDLAASVAAATNAQRVAAGLAPLAYRSCSVPTAWAAHMASTGSLTHNNLMTVLTSCGGTKTAGENIAAGFATPAGVTSGWMNSADHKANILNPNYKTISVGVAQAANGTYYWVEDFTG